jgi:hypothetical protein
MDDALTADWSAFGQHTIRVMRIKTVLGQGQGQHLSSGDEVDIKIQKNRFQEAAIGLLPKGMSSVGAWLLGPLPACARA